MTTRKHTAQSPSSSTPAARGAGDTNEGIDFYAQRETAVRSELINQGRTLMLDWLRNPTHRSHALHHVSFVRELNSRDGSKIDEFLVVVDSSTAPSAADLAAIQTYGATYSVEGRQIVVRVAHDRYDTRMFKLNLNGCQRCLQVAAFLFAILLAFVGCYLALLRRTDDIDISAAATAAAAADNQ